MYRFDWKSPAYNGVAGACHVLEIPFVFNTLDSPDALKISGDSAERRKLADQMHRAWIAFARNGDPNTPEIPEWPRYDVKNRSTLIFNLESSLENDPQREEREVWEKALG
jgi:para-nitrobenzyl esterase